MPRRKTSPASKKTARSRTKTAAKKRVPARVEIDGSVEDQWGYLVKTWATGNSYFPNEGNATRLEAEDLPVPRDLEDLREQLEKVGIAKKVRIPDEIKSLAVIQYSPDVLALRLPPKEMVLMGEEQLSRKGDYLIREFYSAFFSDADLSKEDKLRLHACRIGDYSISSCM